MEKLQRGILCERIEELLAAQEKISQTVLELQALLDEDKELADD
jgi:hypothetical protein